MATVIMQRWDALSPDQYDALRDVVGWDRDVPEGMRFHVASFGDGTLRMTDVWDSEEQFGAFVQRGSCRGSSSSASTVNRR